MRNSGNSDPATHHIRVQWSRWSRQREECWLVSQCLGIELQNTISNEQGIQLSDCSIGVTGDFCVKRKSIRKPEVAVRSVLRQQTLFSSDNVTGRTR